MKNNKKGNGYAISTVIFIVLIFGGLIVALSGFDSVDASHKGVKVNNNSIIYELNKATESLGSIPIIALATTRIIFIITLATTGIIFIIILRKLGD